VGPPRARRLRTTYGLASPLGGIDGGQIALISATPQMANTRPSQELQEVRFIRFDFAKAAERRVMPPFYPGPRHVGSTAQHWPRARAHGGGCLIVPTCPVAVGCCLKRSRAAPSIRENHLMSCGAFCSVVHAPRRRTGSGLDFCKSWVGRSMTNRVRP
jgi:hypothetical protein